MKRYAPCPAGQALHLKKKKWPQNSNKIQGMGNNCKVNYGHERGENSGLFGQLHIQEGKPGHLCDREGFLCQRKGIVVLQIG